MNAKLEIETEETKPSLYQQACEFVSNQVYSLPYSFLKPDQKLSIAETVSHKYALLVTGDAKKVTEENTFSH